MMGARSSVMISTRGHIFFQQGWLNSDDLGTAIDAHIEQKGEGTWEGDQDPSPLARGSAPKREKREAGKGDKDPAILGGVKARERMKREGEEVDRNSPTLREAKAPKRKEREGEA